MRSRLDLFIAKPKQILQLRHQNTTRLRMSFGEAFTLIFDGEFGHDLEHGAQSYEIMLRYFVPLRLDGNIRQPGCGKLFNDFA